MPTTIEAVVKSKIGIKRRTGAPGSRPAVATNRSVYISDGVVIAASAAAAAAAAPIL